MFESSKQLRICRTGDVCGIPTIENLSNKLCLRFPNDWKLFEQAMFEVSQQLRISRTSDVWGIPMIESYSSKQCLRRPNNWKLFEQAMFEVSQRLKAIQTNNVWGVPTIESYSNKQCLRRPNDWKLFKRTMFELISQQQALTPILASSLSRIQQNDSTLLNSYSFHQLPNWYFSPRRIRQPTTAPPLLSREPPHSPLYFLQNQKTTAQWRNNLWTTNYQQLIEKPLPLSKWLFICFRGL